MIARAEIQELLRNFVIAELYTDRQDPAHREKDSENARLQEDRFATAALPLYVVLGPEGRERDRLLGKSDVPAFAAFLKRGLGAVTPMPGGGR